MATINFVSKNRNCSGYVTGLQSRRECEKKTKKKKKLIRAYLLEALKNFALQIKQMPDASTQSAVSAVYKLSILSFQRIPFLDYLVITKEVVMPCGGRKHLPAHRYMLLFLHFWSFVTMGFNTELETEYCST